MKVFKKKKKVVKKREKVLRKRKICRVMAENQWLRVIFAFGFKRAT